MQFLLWDKQFEYFLLFFSAKLLQGQQDGKCFVNFHEGELSFPPTYKYNPGTDEWDTER